MKALFKVSDKRRYLLIIAGLALAAYLTGVLSASTQVTSASATTPTATPAVAATDASASTTTPGASVSGTTASTTVAGGSVTGATTTLASSGVLVADASTTPAASGVLVADATTSAAPSGAASATAPAKTGSSTAASSDPKSVSDSKAAVTAPTESQVTQVDNISSDYTNWVTLGVGNAWVSGNRAQFEHQQNTNAGVFGGVQDLHWQTFIGKTATLTIDGHALVGNHDYDFKVDLTDDKIGYIRAGYTEFRTWYDPNGGYNPLHNIYIEPYDSNPYIDRRTGWVEAGLTLPDWPTLAFRYEYDSREGFIDSTSWADSGTGVPAISNAVKIAPTFLGINETRNIFQGDIKDHIGDTDAGLTLRYEMDNVNDTTFLDIDPLDPLVSSAHTGYNRFVTDQDVEKNDIFNVHGFQETFFNDKVTFSSGFAYSNIDTDLGGSRIYSTSFYGPYIPGIATAASRNEGYINLSGGGNTTEYVENLNLMLTPIKDLVIVPAVRFEYDNSNLDDYNQYLTGTSNSLITPQGATSDSWTSNVAESLEARYTGLRDWSLYASGEWSQEWGNNDWNDTDLAALATPVNPNILNQNWELMGQKYTVGANWYPLSNFNVGAQYYYQIHDYNYERAMLTPAVAYPGYLKQQNFDTQDANIRATWNILNNLQSVTRYDFQYSTVDTWAFPDPGTQDGEIQSSKLVNNIISENVNWTPLPPLYLQVGGSYVLNTLSTPVEGMANINTLVSNSSNNYWTIDASIGYQFDAKTDLQVQGNYYRAADYYNNYYNVTSTSLPYGADEESESITATLTHKINKQIQVSVKYGYFQNRDVTSGGQNNYSGNLVYVSTKFGF